MYRDFSIQTVNQSNFTDSKLNSMHADQHIAAELQHLINTHNVTSHTSIKMYNAQIVRKWKQQNLTTSSMPANSVSLNKRQHKTAGQTHDKTSTMIINDIRRMTSITHHLLDICCTRQWWPRWCPWSSGTSVMHSCM